MMNTSDGAISLINKQGLELYMSVQYVSKLT